MVPMYGSFVRKHEAVGRGCNTWELRVQKRSSKAYQGINKGLKTALREWKEDWGLVPLSLSLSLIQSPPRPFYT
jgi:hypothetical protein